MQGRVVVVTGGTQGIGRAIALGAARAGAEAVLIGGRDARRGAAVVAEIEAAGAKALFQPAELTDPGAADLTFDAALTGFGRVDALVNAGALTDRASAEGGTREAWDALFAANAGTPFFLMQRLIRHLRERKAPGAIVNILSMNVHGGLPSLAIYSAAKAALAVITKNAAFAHRFDRIRVNGINVGWTDTPAERHMQAVTLGLGEGWLDKANAAQPFGRLLNADDVARLALFLLGDDSVPMTGSLVDQEQAPVGPKD
jgi:NAD(P)-dependent dehydrogenase (short-subunit alcohol dehydrogenase family)